MPWNSPCLKCYWLHLGFHLLWWAEECSPEPQRLFPTMHLIISCWCWSLLEKMHEFDEKDCKKNPECLLLTGWHGKEKQTGGTGTLWLRLPFLEIIILSFSCVSQLRKGSTVASKLQQSRVSLSMVQGQSSSSLTRRKGHSPQSLGRWITKYHTLPLPSLSTLNLFMTLRHYLQDHPPAFLPGI